MQIRCPHCDTLYALTEPVAPTRRLRLRCAVCSGVIVGIEPVEAAAPRLDDEAAWHRTLARALVSDLRAYDPEGHARALAENRLLDVFAAGLAEAWMRFKAGAGSTDAAVFREAVRDVLGEGRDVLPDAGSGAP